MVLLVIDDQDDVLEVYREVIHGFGHDVDCASIPAEALRLVRDRLFDAVIIDAKIPYKGAALGGLILADEISGVLGLNAVLLISQHDVRSAVTHFNPHYRFLCKPKYNQDLKDWAQKDLLTKIGSMVRQQYGFVAMPFGDLESDQWYRGVLIPWMEEAGYELRRMDEIATTRAINTELLEKIRQAHFVIAHVSNKNANVFFEAGYAIALDKFTLIFTNSFEGMPFDVRANRAFAIAQADDSSARNTVRQFMRSLRGSMT